jgi:HNH endonuclease
MQIYHAEVSLEEGFQVLDAENKQDRLVKGRKVSRPSGWLLFTSLRCKSIRCCFCDIEADRWIAGKGAGDHIGSFVLNLFAGTRMMTRDHIIPKSLGGRDDVRNLRPACSPCNETRSNEVSPEVIRFAQEHPELLDEGRIKIGIEKLQKAVSRLSQNYKQNASEIERMKQPFREMGYL